MKKLFLILTCSISFFLFEGNSYAQVLRLDSIAGFPDSVQDNEQRTMTLWLSDSGSAFVGDLAILMNSELHDTVPDTLFYSIEDSIGGNGAIDTFQISFTFRAANLDGGDNIVVVWPASIQGSVNPDSLTYHLILKNVGIEEQEKNQFVLLFPNPSSDIIRLRYTHPEKVEQVRVLDVLGNELLNFNGPVDRFSIESLSSGVYFLEVRNKDLSITVKKFFRE